ncbi:YcaO-like family protein [Ensifer aridi]|uniref:YcaO-like family protein n=1 Tax=Ensifer aridi TaxID=1708715 RepID=UPI0009BD27F6|nr:YcaO-like family protein [Ensifer aridi]
MNETHAATAAELGAQLERELSTCRDFRGRKPKATEELVRALFSKRSRFGITRVGSLTRLDRAGVAVVQVVRPLSLSNAVSQGKGPNVMEAAASGLMESLECWAAERIAPERIKVASARQLGDEIRDLYAGCRVHGFDAGWDQLRLGWTDGYDLFTARVRPVPVAMVDTIYTLPSPHPIAFPRSTRGLAASPTMLAAIIHAALEILERASVAGAERYPRSYPELRIDPARVAGPLSSGMLARLEAADLAAGIWLVPGDHDMPVFRCQVMETQRHREIAPMPGEGFACDFTYDRALARALMEAAQARVTALAGAREDITRAVYPERYDREHLDACRQAFLSPSGTTALPADRDEPASATTALTAVLGAIKAAGGQAALVVPLYSSKDLDLNVVRLVVPPLRDLVRE